MLYVYFRILKFVAIYAQKCATQDIVLETGPPQTKNSEGLELDVNREEIENTSQSSYSLRARVVAIRARQTGGLHPWA